jgi:DNA topoisomerase III
MKPEDFADDGRFAVGRVIGAANASYEALRTEPPKRYTQSDLIDEMLAAAKFAKTPKERELLRNIDGLGTSRTREATISGLIDRGFLTEFKAKRSRSRTELKPTEAGMTIVGSLPAMLTDPATTAKWELAFQMVESGKASDADVRRYFEALLAEIVKDAKGLGTVAIPESTKKGAAAANPYIRTASTGATRTAASHAGGR